MGKVYQQTKRRMGKVNKIAIDTMVLIYLINNQEPYVETIKERLHSAKEIILSSVGMGEILAGFEKNNDKKGKLQFLSFLESYKKLSVIGFGKQESLIFGELRGKYPTIKAADAIHLATAISSRVDCFLTNDKKLEIVKDITIMSLV